MAVDVEPLSLLPLPQPNRVIATIAKVTCATKCRCLVMTYSFRWFGDEKSIPRLKRDSGTCYKLLQTGIKQDLDLPLASRLADDL